MTREEEIHFIDELKKKGCSGSLSCGSVRFSSEQAHILLEIMTHLEKNLLQDIELWKKGTARLSIPIKVVLVNEFLEGWELGKAETYEKIIEDLQDSKVSDSRIKVDLVQKYQKIVDSYSENLAKDKRRRDFA